MFHLIIFIIIAYLLGSLSAAILLCRAYGLNDPRTVGSNNPGATNVMRMGGKSLAAQVFFLDAAKGFVAVCLARWAGLEGIDLGWVAVAAIIGHLFPIFHGFKGGKGVATAIGVLLAIYWAFAVIFGVVWMTVYQRKGYSSLASLCAMGVMPLASILIAPHYLIPFSLILIAILWSHRENIRRLRSGKETPPTTL